MGVVRQEKHSEEELGRLQLLARVGARLATSIDYQATLESIVRLVVPELADLSSLDLLEEGHSVRRVIAYHPDPDLQAVLDVELGSRRLDQQSDVFRRALESGKPQLVNLREIALSPERRQLAADLDLTSAIIAPLEHHGRLVGALSVGRTGARRFREDDLSLVQEVAHQAALAIEAALLYRSAQAAIRARDNLMSIVSHDLRNDLTAIRLSAGLLGRLPPGGADFQRQLESVGRAAARMDQLIETLRDATAIQRGELAIDVRKHEVAPLVNEVFATLEPQARARQLRLSLQLALDLPPLRCDRARVLQVLANLLGNSLKFTPAGGEICISVRAVDEHLCFEVHDTGCGIPEEELPHIFERFWKGHGSSLNSTGLGLFIAQGIALAHGGTLRVESQVGLGSSFFLTLPAAGWSIE